MNPFITVLIGIALWTGLVFALGENRSNLQWRKDLVDRPDYIAAIRSLVLAERAIAKVE